MLARATGIRGRRPGSGAEGVAQQGKADGAEEGGATLQAPAVVATVAGSRIGGWGI